MITEEQLAEIKLLASRTDVFDRKTILGLVTEVERLRRGLRAIRDSAMSFASERADNLLAGREWSDAGEVKP